MRIKNDVITIAGQTALGDGITITGNIGIDANDVVIRYLLIRTDHDHDHDAIGARYRKNIIVDQVSASWSSDEVFSLYHNESVTIQWCTVTKACIKEDGSHRFGGIWGDHHGTYPHNLIAHNDRRNPRWASGCGNNDHRNNVFYNWVYESGCGGEGHQKGDRRTPPIEFSDVNIVANYHKPGPATRTDVKDCIASPSSRGDDDYGNWHVAGNFVERFPAVTADNWLGIKGTIFMKTVSPWESMPIQQQSPQDAYLNVLEQVGCSLPKHDSIDERIIKEVRDGAATYGKNGIITRREDVGGWPKLQSAVAPLDSNGDGMPDDWEKSLGLVVNEINDNSSDEDGDGYTNIEEYLTRTSIKGFA